MAILSCIHGNLAALEAVLADIDGIGVTDIVCLGDLVGYGPFPDEVVARVHERGIPSVLGCWDEGIATDAGDCGCAFVSEEEAALGHQAFAWARAEVSAATREALGRLPFAESRALPCGAAVFVHGSPLSTSEYLLESTHELVLLERAARAGCDLLVCGHTHVPYVRRVGGTLRVTAEASLASPSFAPPPPNAASARMIELRPKTIVNAGSVGEPRHGGRAATYVVLDAETGDVSIREVAYDVEATAAAMQRKGVPSALVHRLVEGRELTGKRKEIVCAC